MNRIQLQRVRASVAWFEPCGPAMIARVLNGLSERRPGVRALFPEDSARLNKRAFQTLLQIVENLHQFHRLEEPLLALGRSAKGAGLNAAHYRIIRDELLLTMAELADLDWTAALKSDWTLVLDAVSGVMLRGALGGRAIAA